jgi:hypothetical protein
LATASLPTTTIDLGNLDENAVSTLVVQGLDASGKTLVYGQSIPIQYGTLESSTLPIFVQRTGELARLPSNLSDSRQAPLLSPVQGQYLFVGGGSESSVATTTSLFDFGSLTPLTPSPTMPFAPATVAFAGPYALLVDSAMPNGATYYDFTSNTQGTQLTPPMGGSFVDIAGGQVIIGDSGVEYVVGATRTTGMPTDAVLVIDTANSSNSQYITGNLTWAHLSDKRLGASAAWVSGRGLVVTGGSATAHGVEVLSPSATQGAALPYAPDPSVGAGSGYLPSQKLLLVAGGLGPGGADAGVRTVDPACASNCTPTPWAALPVPVGNAQMFSFVASVSSSNPASGIVFGSDAMGTTHAFLLTSTAATEVPTKVPHKNARVSISPLGSILVVGGASEIESFYP